MYKLFLALVMYLPFQLAINPTAGVDLASIRALILILFCMWLAQGLKNKNIQIKNNLQTWLVSAFLFLNALSLITAKNINWSARKLLFLFSIFPIYFVASRLISNKKRLLEVINIMVFSGAVMAIIGITQFLLQFVVGLEATYAFWAEYLVAPFLGNSFGAAVLQNPSWLVNIAGKTYLRATALFPDPHMLAFYLGLIMPLALGLLVKCKKRKVLTVVALGVIFLADILTFSRGGYFGLMAGWLVIGIFFWHKINKRHKVAVGAILILGLLSLFISSPFSQRFFSSFDLKEGSNQGRIEMWVRAVEVIREKTWLGAGIGNYPLEVRSTATYRDPIYAHNTYLDIAAETGIINLFVWLGILLVTLIGFWRKSQKESLFLFGVVSLVIFSAHSLFETAIYSPVVLALFLIILSFNNTKLSDEKNS